MLGVSAVCYLIGVFVKMKCPKTDNSLIPLICGLSGGVLTLILHICILKSPWNEMFFHLGEGILAGLSATGIKELTKIMKKGE